MCGRYTLTQPGEIPSVFEVSDTRIEPRFNVAPTQELPVIVQSGGEREVRSMRWGLVPHWYKDVREDARMINARAETVHEKPAFQESFQRRRCLVPADGFYEWKSVGNQKQPFLFRFKDRSLFALAGLWDRNETGDSPLETYAILTCDANSLVQEVHHRMPVILPYEAYPLWLDDDTSLEKLKRQLRPFSEEPLESFPVHRRVNRPQNDDPSCLQPAEEQQQLSLDL